MSRAAKCQNAGCGKTWPIDPVLIIECPTCHAPAGRNCRSPSGHNPWHAGGRFHPARDLAADAAGHYGPCPLGICGLANRKGAANG